MTKEPKGEKELAAQIAASWSTAKAQMEKLREAVEKNAELGQAKVKLEAAQREREAKLVALGEAAWTHFREAKDVPPGVKRALEALKVVEAKLAAQKSSIADLLAEAEVVREKPAPRKPVVKK